MAKSKRRHLSTPMGNHLPGKMMSKVSCLSDYHSMLPKSQQKGHTRPVIRNKFNDGHNDPSRKRHAATKARRAANNTKVFGQPGL